MKDTLQSLPLVGSPLDSPVLAAAAMPWATGPVNVAQVLGPPRVITRGEFEQQMDDYQGRLAAAMHPDGLRLDLLPLGPFGGTLADLGYTQLPAMTGGTPGRPVPAHDIGMRLLDAGVRAAGKPVVVGKVEEGKGEEKKEAPPFPGFDAPVGQLIGWAQFYNQVKAKFPDELSFDAIKEQAKNFLIQQGLDYVKKELERLAVDAVAAALGPAMDDAIKTAGEASGGLLDKVGAILDDPLGKAEELLVSQLPNLANKGIDALLGGVFGKDEELSGGALVAKLAAKEMLSGMASAMLSGVKDLNGLISNFENMQSKLFGQLKKFFTGGDFTPGQASLPLARQADKDDKVDFVITGLGTVLAEGLAAARVLDTLMPSGQPIAIGSATVMIGGLPAARQTSLTSVPSAMKTGAAQVLVEGVTVASVTPDGVPYCPADPKAAAAALAKPAAGAAAGGAGGKGAGPKGDGKAEGGAKPGETKPPAKPGEKPPPANADQKPQAGDPKKDGEQATNPDDKGKGKDGPPAKGAEADPEKKDPTATARDAAGAAADGVEAAGKKVGAEYDKQVAAETNAQKVAEADAKQADADRLKQEAADARTQADADGKAAKELSHSAGDNPKDIGDAQKAHNTAGASEVKADELQKSANVAQAEADNLRKGIPDDGLDVAKNMPGGKITGAMADLAKGAAKNAPIIGNVLDAGEGLYNVGSEIYEGDTRGAVKAGTEALGGVAGGTGGAFAGAAAGAAIGSVVPIVGTAAGAVVGGVIGAYWGDTAGKAVGRGVGDLASDQMGLAPEIVDPPPTDGRVESAYLLIPGIF